MKTEETLSSPILMVHIIIILLIMGKTCSGDAD